MKDKGKPSEVIGRAGQSENLMIVPRIKWPVAEDMQLTLDGREVPHYKVVERKR